MKRNFLISLLILLTMLMPVKTFCRTIIAGSYYPIVKTSTDGTTLTFLCTTSSIDTSAGVTIENDYTSAPSWCNTKVKKIIFDASFAKYNPSSASYWLSGCSNLTTIEGIEYLNADSLQTADYMFNGCSNLTSIDLSGWNTYKLTSCRNMFQNCSKLKTIYGNSWDITKNMDDTERTKFIIYQEHQSVPYMFNGCKNLVGSSGTKYNASLVNDYTYCHIDDGTSNPGYFTMKSSSTTSAYGVDYLGTLTIYYDKLINARVGKKYEFKANETPGWCGSTTITKIIIDSSMRNYSFESTSKIFYCCYELKEIEGLNNLSTDKTKDMSQMFYNCCSLESIDLSELDTRSVTNMSQMFYQCFSLKKAKLKMNTSKVKNMSEMFYYCFNLTSLDLNSFDTGSVIDMHGMFYCCKKLKTLNISNFNTEKVTDMSRMFTYCYSLSNINLNNFNTMNVTDMSCMFGEFKIEILRKPVPIWYTYSKTIQDKSDLPTTNNINSIDITNFDTSNVTNMSGMFWNCNNLTSLELRNFNTSKVTNMSNMFSGCNNMTSLNISTFNTDNVTSFNNMFAGCNNLTSLDVNIFSTANATILSGMFSGCSKLKTLHLGGFSNANVTDMSNMFKDCAALTSIYVLDTWKTSSVTNSTDMFTGCTNLVGGNGTRFDSGKTDKEYARVDASGTPGYLTNILSPIPSGKQAYAVIDGTTMTFYYDNKSGSRSGVKYQVKKNASSTDLPTWILDNRRMNVTKVVFDKSFSDYRPTSTAYWFYIFAELTSIEGITNLNTSQVTNMAEMFRYCYVLPSLDLSTFDTHLVSDMSCMFCYCFKLSSINISSFNTSKVTTMSHMFHCCPISSIDVSKFDTQNVTDMSIMFAQCQHLKTLDLKNFNTSKVTDMTWMFVEDPMLTTINVTDKWSTASVRRSGDMFYGSTRLVGSMGTTYDAAHTDHEYAQIDGGLCDPGYLSGEYISNIPAEPYAVYKDQILTFYYDTGFGCRKGDIYKIENDYYFKDFSHNKRPKWNDINDDIVKVVFDDSFANYYPETTSCWLYRPYMKNDLLRIEGIKNLNTEKVKDMSAMFFSCSKLEELDLSRFNTKNVTSMSFMFYNCDSLKTINVSSFNTSNVTDMQYMFFSCDSVRSLNVKNFNTSKVENMQWMFGGCDRITNLNLVNFNTSKVKDMSYMFCECNNLKSLNISSFNTKNVTNMSHMFEDLRIIPSLDVTNFNTSNVTDMLYMFECCKSITSLDVSNFDVRNVKRMEGMFRYCEAMKNLDLSSFKPDNLNSMEEMFYGCKSLESINFSNFYTTMLAGEFGFTRVFENCESLKTLDLTTFNTEGISSFSSLFSNCYALRTIYVSNYWSTNSVNSGNAVLSGDMFKGCSNLVGGAGTKYDASHTDYTYARIDGGVSKPGYFTYKAAPIAKGDVDGNGNVNTSDIVALTNVIAGKTTDSSFKARADINGDDVVNIADVMQLVNFILSK